MCSLPLRKICVTKAIVRDCWHLKWPFCSQVILEVVLLIMNTEGRIHFQKYLVNFAVLHSMILKHDKHLLQYDLPLETGPRAAVAHRNGSFYFMTELLQAFH